MKGRQAMEFVLEEALGAGALEAEAFRSEKAATTVRVHAGRLEQYVTARSDGIGVRLFRDGRCGFFYTTHFERQALRERVRSVLATLPSLPEDPAVGLPDIPKRKRCGSEGRPCADLLQVHDPAVARLRLEDRIAFLIREEGAARRLHPGIKTDWFLWEDTTARTSILSTRGLDAAWRETTCYANAMANIRKGKKGGGADVYRYHRRVDGLLGTTLGRPAAERALVQLRGKPLAPRKTTVVFGPEQASDLLHLLAQATSAEAVQKGESFLAGRLGKRAASRLFTLVDDATLPGGPASRPFDDEGVPSQPVVLLERGLLRDLLYDAPSARRAGRSSNGHAARSSYRSPVGIAPTNLVLLPGRTRPAEGIAGIREGLLVLQVTETGGASPASGDFSVEAYGYRIVRGRIDGPVAGITIASTLPEMLRNVAWVGDDPAWHGTVYSPTLAIEGMTIAG